MFTGHNFAHLYLIGIIEPIPIQFQCILQIILNRLVRSLFDLDENFHVFTMRLLSQYAMSISKSEWQFSRLKYHFDLNTATIYHFAFHRIVFRFFHFLLCSLVRQLKIDFMKIWPDYFYTINWFWFKHIYFPPFAHQVYNYHSPLVGAGQQHTCTPNTHLVNTFK